MRQQHQSYVFHVVICLSLGNAAVVRLLHVQPSSTGACPSSWQLTVGTGASQVCTRSSHPSSSLISSSTAAFATAANPKGLGVFTRITGSVQAYQKGSMDAFEAGLRTSTSIDSSDYVDGMAVTIGSPRTHIFTLAVGASYDSNLGTNSMCPCHSGTQTAYCGGDAPPSFVPSAELICDSGNLGGISTAWEPRLIQASFDVSVPSSSADVEVRLMSDQVSTNEDLGIVELVIDIHEAEDTVPPVISLVGAQKIQILHGNPFVDPGATCVDAVDGPLPVNITGSVDMTLVSAQELIYSCEDARQNEVNTSRIVVVVDQAIPAIALNGNDLECVTRGLPYSEYGATCNDNIDGSFAATTVGLVDTTQLGVQSVTYYCIDASGNNNTATRTVRVVSDALPGDLYVEYFAVEVGGSELVFGAKSNASNVDPNTPLILNWSEPIVQVTEGCRFVSIYKLSVDGSQTLVEKHETVQLFLQGRVRTEGLSLILTNLTTLEDETPYKVVLDEHIVTNATGGDGNPRHTFLFTTGDYTAPSLLATSPFSGELSWPSDGTIELNFSEPIGAGASTSYLRLLDVVQGSVEQVPCNGSTSSSGLWLALSNAQIQVQGASAIWRSCTDFRLDADAGCVIDTSANRNSAGAIPSIGYVTSCVTHISPANGSLGVPIDSPIVLTLAEPVQLAPSGSSPDAYLVIQPLGGSPRYLSANDYPWVYVQDNVVTIDLACSTKYCSIFANSGNASATNFSSMGLCAGLQPQQCRGKRFQVSIGASALLRSNGTWPAGSLMNGFALPAQLETDPYYIALRTIDATPPRMILLDAYALSETSIEVRIRLDESGSVHCAALGGTDGDPCSGDITLIEEYSNGSCGNETPTHCKDCEFPSFGCFNRTAMWVDDGCAGRFQLEGVQLDCLSSEVDKTVHDGAYHSILSLGHRHACALKKEDGAAVCWGKADYIDPGSLGPPMGTFDSVAAGFQHTCAILRGTGDVLCWGTNSYGETAGPSSSSGSYIHITSGYRFSCALRSDNGTAECWGLNDAGQCSPPNVAFSTISAGDRHVCGVRSDDFIVECWGLDTDGQSSPPTDVEFLARSPDGTALWHGTLSAGWFHTCGIQRIGGGIRCWGKNADGQTDAPQDSAAFLAVASGRAHSCGIHKLIPGILGSKAGMVRNGTLRCWGLNDYQQSSPPTSLAPLGALAAGDDYTCALAIQDGSIQCWGKNGFLQASPPTVDSLGLPDEFSNVTCNTDTSISSRRVRGLIGRRDASAVGSLVYDPNLGYSEALLQLTGLSESRTYGVYCTAADLELPVANMLSERQVLSAGRSVTTPDRTPPTVVIMEGAANTTVEGAITLNLQLSEPGLQIYCSAVRDREPAPSGREIIASVKGDSGYADTTRTSQLAAQVTLFGLALDTEFDVYCTSRDSSGNWGTDASVLQTKRDVHVLRNIQPPKLLSTSPASGSVALCEPDGPAAGCKTSITFTFDIDVYRGAGNLSLVCQSNFLYCQDRTVPLSMETFSGGNVYLQNTKLIVSFTEPLTDASEFKVVIDSGAVQDVSGNEFVLDSSCPAWLSPSAQTSLPGACDNSFVFQTPS